MQAPEIAVDESDLRATVEYLAAIHRPSASPGELEAADWIAGKLRERGCAADIEVAMVHGGYWLPVGILTAAATLSGILSLRGRRWLGVLGGLQAALAIADDIDAGSQPLRKAVLPKRPTWNVVATTGDPDADRTVVVLAHHDAAHSGLIFDPRPQKALYDRFPRAIEGQSKGLPYWYPVVGGPILVALGSLLGIKALTRIGVFLGAASTVLMADIGHRDAVPGANDNLSGVAVLLALAGALQERPVRGLRVMLVSAGSEESLQEGILAFARRHFAGLPPDRTWFLNLDTVGSPNLYMVEGEGVLKMRDYDAGLRELVASVAGEHDIPLRRGVWSRSSTDAVVPVKAGYPAVLLTSLTEWKALANYHWPTDTAANVDYSTVAAAASLTEAVVRRLAQGG